MARTDEVMVQPVTTYMEGAEHKNERSQPYAVPRWHGEELKANGFARIVGAEAKPEPQAPEAPQEATDPAPASSNASRPATRRSGARG